ncbi:MAG: RecQ family zinc-binding domain-containing protein, partial [Pirellulales bacterium]|nr:RecQ family zinc-binding domain-containing protein [Pirellulales bacterium]
LYQRLVVREQAEIARIDEVFQLAAAEACQAATLAAHFGESVSQPCRRCTACRGEGPHRIVPLERRPIGSAAQKALEELAKEFPDRFTTVRDRARFLCGLSSPHFVRSRLTRNPHFGICQRIPFADVLEQLGR